MPPTGIDAHTVTLGNAGPSPCPAELTHERAWRHRQSQVPALTQDEVETLLATPGVVEAVLSPGDTLYIPRKL